MTVSRTGPGTGLLIVVLALALLTGAVAADGRMPRSNFEVFANGFAGVRELKDPHRAAYRPSGLALAPDGALYISDDQRGRIWKVVRR
jgi:glucose/arabinose dehydrogenase